MQFPVVRGSIEIDNVQERCKKRDGLSNLSRLGQSNGCSVDFDLQMVQVQSERHVTKQAGFNVIEIFQRCHVASVMLLWQ